MNNVIEIHTPNINSINYGTSLQIKYEVKDIDVHFKSVVFLLNDTIVKTETLTRSVFSVTPVSGMNSLKAYCLNKFDKKIINTDVEFFVECITETIQKEVNINEFIEFQLPDFIRIDYPNFVDFIKTYYKFLETCNDPDLVIYNLENYRNIDDIPTFILDKIKQETMKDWGLEFSNDKETNLPINDRNIVKNIKEFYDSKGTENSIRFLFRILYDKEIDIFYPRTAIFKPSASVYERKTILKCHANNNENIGAIKSGIIYQENEDGEYITHARISNIVKIIYRGNYYIELELKELVGKFESSKETKVKTTIDGAEEILTLNVIYEESETGMLGIYGSTILSEWLRDCKSGLDNIDIVLAGDSNVAHGLYGWIGGLMHGMIQNGIKMYATPIFGTYESTGSAPAGYKCYALNIKDVGFWGAPNQTAWNSKSGQRVSPGRVYGKPELTKHFNTNAKYSLTPEETEDIKTLDKYTGKSCGLKMNADSPLDYMICTDKVFASWNVGVLLGSHLIFCPGNDSVSGYDPTVGSNHSAGYIVDNFLDCPLLLEDVLRYRVLVGNPEKSTSPHSEDNTDDPLVEDERFALKVVSHVNGQDINIVALGGSETTRGTGTRKYSDDPKHAETSLYVGPIGNIPPVKHVTHTNYNINTYNKYWIPHELQYNNQTNSNYRSATPLTQTNSLLLKGTFVWHQQPNYDDYTNNVTNRKDPYPKNLRIYRGFSAALHSIYAPIKGASTSAIECHPGGTMMSIRYDIVNTNDETLQLLLQEYAERQIAAGGSGRVCLYIQGGVNDVGQYYLGREDMFSPESYKENILDIVKRIRGVWGKIGYDSAKLCFVAMSSQSVVPGSTYFADLQLYRDILKTIDEPDVTIIDITEIIPYSDYSSYGRDDMAHLVPKGYDTIATKIVENLLKYTNTTINLDQHITNTSNVSDTKVLQDSNYYQDFSYDIQSDIDPNKHIPVVKKNVHPAGFKVFGSFSGKSNINLKVSGSTYEDVGMRSMSPHIGYYLPYVLNTVIDLYAVPTLEDDEIVYISPYEYGYTWGANGTIEPTSSYDSQITTIMQTNTAQTITAALSPSLDETQTTLNSQFVYVDASENIFIPTAKIIDLGNYWVVGRHWNNILQEDINTETEKKSFLEFTINDIINIPLTNLTG